MSEKKSQVVIPINPPVLFTTLAATFVVAIISYFVITLPQSITSINENLISIEASQQNTTRKITEMVAVVSGNTTSIRDIETSRFSDRDARSLSATITAEIKTELSAWFSEVNILKKEVEHLKSKIKDNVEEIKLLQKTKENAK